jgi:hypothetical protein
MIQQPIILLSPKTNLAVARLVRKNTSSNWKLVGEEHVITQ